jgi:hypothetical protein
MYYPMDKKILCFLCGNDANNQCDICGIQLCGRCTKIVIVTRKANMVNGVITSPLESGTKRYNVCKNCLDKEEWVDR